MIADRWKSAWTRSTVPRASLEQLPLLPSVLPTYETRARAPRPAMIPSLVRQQMAVREKRQAGMWTRKVDKTRPKYTSIDRIPPFLLQICSLAPLLSLMRWSPLKLLNEIYD